MKNVIKKALGANNRFLYNIDRMLSQGQGRQILWMALVVCVLVALFWGISASFGLPFTIGQIIQLILAPGEFVEHGANYLTYQVIVNLVGLVLVSSLLISLLSNIVENRASAFNRGLLRYRFHDHILFLGADEMLIDTINGQCDEHGHQPIVVLTEQDAEEVRKRLMAQIQTPSLRRRLIVLYGHRTQEEQLVSVYAQRAQRIFILGEPEEEDHDSRNILSLSLIKDLLSRDTHVVECYFLCNHLNTLRIMQLQTAPLPWQLHLTVMNTPESWAQRVLVNGNGYPSLNHHQSPSADDTDYVHLVLLGASQMAYALAFTAAHVAHYPNYITRGLRTRITIVDPQMDIHSEFLRSHYDSLFRLSRRTQVRWENIDGKRTKIEEPYIPEPDNDFLDIEWQFITARPETPEVRAMLEQWSTDKDQMLTVAVCMDDMRAALATALYLPDSIMSQQIPVLVYQSTNAALAEWTKDFTRYKNIYPFGMREDCYDKDYQRRLHWAKMANEAYEDNAARLNPKRVRKYWNDLKLTLQFSNLYSANYCYSILQHIDPQYHAQLEHQRWLTERLLLGYKAMDKAERIRIEQLPEEQKWKEMERLEPYFLHPNIQPFDELTEESVRKDEVMVQCQLAKLPGPER